MWHVLFAGHSLNILDQYIERYQEYFLDRFSDTGIWSEDRIRHNYESEAIQLYDALQNYIVMSMSREIIGYENVENGLRMSVLFFERRILFVEYREDLEAHTRYIHTLKIIHR